MSGCRSCGPQRRCAGGCHDFGSRADRGPNLAAIDVAASIFRQAMRNLLKRIDAAAAGDMTEDELAEANQKLVDWLAVTFAGRNPHFETDPDWHPAGLASHLMQVFGAGSGAERLHDDEAVIEAAAEAFLRDAERLAPRLLLRAGSPAAAGESPEAADFAERWAYLFTGAPLGGHAQ